MKPLARYASLNGYVELCRSLDVDPVPLMRAVGLDPIGLGVQDRWIPAASIARLLDRTAVASGYADFGARLAERRQFSNLGPLSLVVREEPDVRSALRVLTRYEHTYNEALRTRMSESNGLVTLRVDLDVGEAVETRQSIELAVGVLYRLLRGFLGGGWKPLAVCFPHSPPADAATHRRLFGPALNFGHEFAGVVIESGDLDAVNKMSDPLLRPYTQQLLDSWEPSDDVTIVSRVRELIELLLPTGRCSVEQVARSLGVDRRTVHRRLAESGASFSTVLDATRVELAERMVANPRLSLTEIADMLSFSAPSNFSRWFSGRFGCSPSRWRAQRVGDTG
ncbi:MULTISPECIES: AraC family transcriptional regulator [unclassified Rhodococcus (in: high G+C Gram-positive bacteria)]|uniref:AraC family transcriptional regulator n=1 Tax=unclassified Rhodococcus (in: high G+C Gram-positive bacteria) TaxID=192944 RepID=UPI00163B52D1|nr:MULTISPECIES: AraC family transcriptional regulator [unclassified Rhodococcus (in: high G+C Gram-positive bacteria)]MBC2641178.1 AraC family transcriptional regulator [Rhodococcus sp. 3A]MBC2894077.1 AraC family transcriptional regulator [Rhodococcus sp. 4CII]